MKKYLMLAAVLMGLAVSRAEAVVPYTDASDDVVSYTTVAFSSAGALCFTGDGEVVGVIVASWTFTESTNRDFVMFRDTSSLISNAESAGRGVSDDYNTHAEFARVHVSTQHVTSNTNLSMQEFGRMYKLPNPIRVKKGLVGKASWATCPMITIMYREYGAQGKKPRERQ